MNNFLFAFLGDVFKVIGFVLFFPTLLCNSIAQYFYDWSGVFENNDEEMDDE